MRGLCNDGGTSTGSNKFTKGFTRANTLVEESGQAFTCALSHALELGESEVIIVSAEGGKYELFNVSNGTVTATFTPVKTSRY